MSHLLSTMNEEAAAAIDTPPELPDIGTIVVYIPRAGMMRMGRREFPALVLASDYEKQTLQLLVMMEPEDMMLEDHVVFQGHNQPHHCWRYVRKMPEQSIAENARLDAYGKRLAALEAQVWGDYQPVDASIFDILSQFEAKLAEKAAGKAKKG